ncbi:PIG-L family deacetylase [Nostoc sp. CCCryo 231-06]|nr:PIG-L family deacetylase [Nostoc sp. CCCryo 231-06]
MVNILNRLKVSLHNKLWLFNYRLRELQIRLQFYWLLYRGSQPLNVSDKSLIVFAPHQDDEALGCGGIIALKREQNIPIKVVFVTDGGGSHQGNPKISRSEIIQIRKQEALTALNILGVDSKDIHFLNKSDGSLHKMTEAEQQQTIEEMAQLLHTFQPQEVYVTHKRDRSRDHEITYQLVETAIVKAGVKVDLWEYAIWLLWKSLLFRDLKFDELAGAHRLSIHTVQSKKNEAIKTYRSQYLPIDAESSAVLPPGFLWRFFLPHEVFFKSELPKL